MNVLPTKSRFGVLSFVTAAFAILLFGCGGTGGGSNGSGGSGSNGGGGSGGGGVDLSISLLGPSIIMEGIPLAQVDIYGQGFVSTSQVLIDGVPSLHVDYVDSGTLETEIPDSLTSEVGTHQFAVQSGSLISNALTFTVYTAQPGPQVMQAIPGYLIADAAPDPTFIAVADINGDGLSDVVMPGINTGSSDSVAVFYGQADGTLSPVQFVPTPMIPYALTAADVNGDGNVDLVFITIPSPNAMTLNVSLGDGHGNFQPGSAQPTLPAGYSPGPMYLTDLDGDGKPDLVFCYYALTGSVGNLVWMKNKGDGTFAAPVTLAPLAKVTFSIGDFNGDAEPDILYTPSGSSSLHILFNQGIGTFKDQLVAGLNGISGQVTIMDFNLDGIPDLVMQVIQGQTVQLYSFAGKGDGSFTQPAITNMPQGAVQFAVGDFDHDGFPDLAGPAGLEPTCLLFLFGDGHGNFVPQEVVGPQGGYVATGDFNGDGLPDVVVPDQFNFVSLALGRKDRNFPSALSLSPATATSLATGDVNGDGLPEILIGGDPIQGIPATLFLNQGNSSFTFGANLDPGSFSLADLTGKGVVDLLAGKGPNLIIWPNNLSLDFSSSPITVPQEPVNGPITVADMDGDGHPDIVAVGEILYGNSSYQFTAIPTQPQFGAPYVVGDFNGDGKPDIATGGFTYLNTGNRTFKKVTGTLPLSNGAMAVVGDFNGDGKDDVAINLPGAISISMYYSRGDGTFYQGTQIDPGQYPSDLAVADFDGDGRIDLAINLQFSHQACIFFNGGNGQFTRSFFATGASTGAMVAADLNHNGKPDLVFTNFLFDFQPANADVVFHK